MKTSETCLHPDRSSEVQLAAEIAFLHKHLPVEELYNSVTDLVVILNPHRQIVFANEAMCAMLNVPSMDPLLGKRPGEVLSCVHSTEEVGGCGASECCKTCGAFRASLRAQSGDRDLQECRINQEAYEASLDLLVKATPLDVDCVRYISLAIKDVSHEKRRRVLERVFFHDVLNTASGIQGLSEVIAEVPPDDLPDFTHMLSQSASQLLEELQCQRMLSAAENQDLRPATELLDCTDLLEKTQALYSNHEVAFGKKLEIIRAEQGMILADRTLMARVLGNMCKNALEASAKGERVTLSVQAQDKDMVFEVHNASWMPREVQLQVFQRSFSTKGPGRGIGTYSMKLLAEHYLGASVWFESREDWGTSFFLRLPAERWRERKELLRVS